MIYLFVFSLSLFLLNASRYRYGTMKWLCVVVALLIPALLAGFRDSTIGTDTIGYPSSVFYAASHSRSLAAAFAWNGGTVENLYVTIAYFCTHVMNDFNFFLTVVSLITIGLVYGGVRVTKVNPAWLFLLFFLYYYNASLNAQRQAMALAGCLPCIGYAMQKNLRMTLVFFVLCYCLHHSALLFGGILFLYWLVLKHPAEFAKKKTFVLVVLAIVLVMVSFNMLLSYLGSFGIGEEKYITRYGSSDEYGSNVPISLLALNGFNMFVFWKMTKHCGKGNVISLFGRYMTVMAFLLCFLGLISTFAVRICDYFTFVNILLIAAFVPAVRKFWKYSVVAFYLFYFVMTIMVANLGYTYPYSSKILESLLNYL